MEKDVHCADVFDRPKCRGKVGGFRQCQLANSRGEMTSKLSFVCVCVCKLALHSPHNNSTCESIVIIVCKYFQNISTIIFPNWRVSSNTLHECILKSNQHD